MKWLDRSLITGPYLALCTTEKGYQKLMADMGIPKPWNAWVSSDANATTHLLKHRCNDVAAIVCIRVNPEHSGTQVAALIVHEAVHVWQNFREYIGEDSPSHEFEAYSIQNISHALMESYAEQAHVEGMAHNLLVRTLQGLYKKAGIEIPKQLTPSTEINRLAKALKGSD